MISYSKTLRTTAMLCTILTAGLAVGQDGVVRMSDRSVKSGSDAGVVRMRALQPRQQIKQASLTQAGTNAGAGDGCCSSHAPGCEAPCCEVPGCEVPQTNCGYCPQSCESACNSGCDPCNTGGVCCCDGGFDCGCDSGSGCNCQSCYMTSDCNQVFSSGHGSGMRGCRNGCNCGRCGGRDCYGSNRRNRWNGQGNGATLFAGSVDSGTGSACRDLYHGQAMSYHNKNARLADKLFGWMIPSGCGGQGCPPCGKYHMTYAEQPDYINPNDTQIYATHQYGMPITVPLAPNVNHTYNYSAGIPSSRITTIGNYNPQTSPQRLPHQSW